MESIRQGSRADFSVQRADDSAISATFTAQHKTDKTVIITKEQTYDSDGMAFFVLQGIDTEVIGEYEYQVAENFATGSPDIYPNKSQCFDCELPVFEICVSLPRD